MSDDSISIEIDGQTYSANKGEMIIEVADRNGVHIDFCQQVSTTQLIKVSGGSFTKINVMLLPCIVRLLWESPRAIVPT